MDLRDAITTTGAVRRFRPDPVDHRTVLDVLDDARFAPSGGNRQPWRVAIVDNSDIRRAMAALMRPVWDEYVAAGETGQTPFNCVDYERPSDVAPDRQNELLDRIDDVPVVLAVAADLRSIALMDGHLDRPALTGGASIYPFCWSILLAARSRGLGGVMTTFLSRSERQAAELLGLPEHHALAAVMFLGVPEHQPTKLTRRPAEVFTTIDRFDAVTIERG
jgi:nitroreductase